MFYKNKYFSSTTANRVKRRRSQSSSPSIWSASNRSVMENTRNSPSVLIQLWATADTVHSYSAPAPCFHTFSSNVGGDCVVATHKLSQVLDITNPLEESCFIYALYKVCFDMYKVAKMNTFLFVTCMWKPMVKIINRFPRKFK